MTKLQDGLHRPRKRTCVNDTGLGVESNVPSLRYKMRGSLVDGKK